MARTNPAKGRLDALELIDIGLAFYGTMRLTAPMYVVYMHSVVFSTIWVCKLTPVLHVYASLCHLNRNTLY